MPKLLTFFLLTFLGVRVLAHEPYLVLTANTDSTVTIEAGFSDGSDVEGLKLSVRDRSSGDEIGTHALPSGGILNIEIPTTPYRVVFDGGPGHKVSKPGPPRPLVAAIEAALPVAPKTAGQTSNATDTTKEVSPALPATTSNAALVSQQPLDRMWIVVTAVFLLATICFLLGFLAGRNDRDRK